MVTASKLLAATIPRQNEQSTLVFLKDEPRFRNMDMTILHVFEKQILTFKLTDENFQSYTISFIAPSQSPFQHVPGNSDFLRTNVQQPYHFDIGSPGKIFEIIFSAFSEVEYVTAFTCRKSRNQGILHAIKR